MKYKIPDNWFFAWDEKEDSLCSECSGNLITIRQFCGDYTQYEIRCSKCGNLEGKHYD